MFRRCSDVRNRRSNNVENTLDFKIGSMTSDDVVLTSGTDVDNRLNCKVVNVNLFNMSWYE